MPFICGPDPDREGEAIAWHIAEEIHAKEKPIYRVLFYELTQKAIQEALAHPRELNREALRSAAGQAHPRSPGGLPDLSHPLAKGEARSERRPGAISRSAVGMRARKGDPRVHF